MEYPHNIWPYMILLNRILEISHWIPETQHIGEADVSHRLRVQHGCGSKNIRRELFNGVWSRTVALRQIAGRPGKAGGEGMLWDVVFGHDDMTWHADMYTTYIYILLYTTYIDINGVWYHVIPRGVGRATVKCEEKIQVGIGWIFDSAVESIWFIHIQSWIYIYMIWIYVYNLYIIW